MDVQVRTPTNPSRPRPRLLAGRKLATRELNSVVRPQFLYFVSEIARKKLVNGDTKNPRQDEQLQIGYASSLSLDFRYGNSAGIPAKELQFHGQLILRPSPFFAHTSHLRPNDIQMVEALFDTEYRNEPLFEKMFPLLNIFSCSIT